MSMPSDPWWTSAADPWQQSGSASAPTTGTASVVHRSQHQLNPDATPFPAPSSSSLNPNAISFPAPVTAPLNPDAIPFPAPPAAPPNSGVTSLPTTRAAPLNRDATPFPAPAAAPPTPEASSFPTPALAPQNTAFPSLTPVVAPPSQDMTSLSTPAAARLNSDATPFRAPAAAPLNPNASPFPVPTTAPLNSDATSFQTSAVDAAPLNPDATPFPAPAAGQAKKDHDLINECCLDFEAKTLNENNHVTFDGACRYIAQKSGVKMDVLLSKTSAYPALNTLLRKEQALRMYLLSYRSLHSVWSVEDIRRQFPSSSFCCKEGLPGTWEALRLGELCSHPLFREIFPEMSDAVEDCRCTASEAMDALQIFRFSIGVTSRVDLQAFDTWYEAKHGIAFARGGVYFPSDRLPLVLSAQNVAFKLFGEISRAARARFIANVVDWGEESVQKIITNCQDWSQANQKEIKEFVERWSGAANVSFSRAVAEISLWVQHILDAELDPVVQLLCAGFVSTIHKDFAANMDTDLPALRSPSEVIRLIQVELAACHRVSLEWLLAVEQKIVGRYRCFEEALGQTQKMSFLQFLTDTSTLADTITAKMSAHQEACSLGGMLSYATVVKATLSALRHYCSNAGMSSPILDVQMLLSVEHRVRRQLQIVGSGFASWKSFAQFLAESMEIREAGWHIQATQYEPFEHWVQHVSAIDKVGIALAEAHFRVRPGTLGTSGEKQSSSIDGLHWEANLLQGCTDNSVVAVEEDESNVEQPSERENHSIPAPPIGLLGEVTEQMAISALLHAPLLQNVAESTLWSHVFQPSLGHLHAFLDHVATGDGLSNIGLAFLIPSKHLADTSLAPTFLRIPCNSSYEQLDASIHRGCATTVAAHLCALTCESKSSMKLHAFHFSQFAAHLSMEVSMKLCIGVLTKLPERLAEGSLGQNVVLPVMQRVQAYADMALMVAEHIEGALLRLGLLGVSWKISAWVMKLQSIFESGSEQGSAEDEVAEAAGTLGCADMEADKTMSKDEESEGEEDDMVTLLHPAQMQTEGSDDVLRDACGSDRITHNAEASVGSAHPEFVIENIYAGFMLDSAEASALQESLGGALQRLSDDLYRDRHHHVFELLQNFADNSYPKGAQRLVKFVLDSSQLVALNNEVGFTEKNVKALCAVNMSTKQFENIQGASGIKIGCKGIGFKSVFKITDTPIIHSGPWHFNFDASLRSKDSSCKLKGLGFIVPHKLPSSDKQNPMWTTEIRLPFKSTLSDLDRTHIAEDIENLDGEVLLFIPIDSIETCDATGRERVVHKEILCEHLVRVWSQSGVNRTHLDYLIQKHCQMGPGGGTIELVLALPLPASDISNSGLWLQSREPEKFTYCSLPLSNFGWRVLISANFDVTASRDQVHDSAWNQQIRKELPTLFVKFFHKIREQDFMLSSTLAEGEDAFDFFVASISVEPKVRCLPHCFLFRFLPKPGELGQGSSAFFRGCEARIWEAFKNERCIFSVEEEWHLPGKTFVAPEIMRNSVPLKLLQDATGLHYVHSRCVPPSEAALKLLGIKQKDDILPILLKVWNWALCAQYPPAHDHAWVASILDLMYLHLFDGPMALCEKKLKQLRGIRLVPVTSENDELQMVAPSSKVFLPGREPPNEYCSGVLEAFQILIVSPLVLKHSEHIANLLGQLGIVELSATSLISSVVLPFFESIPADTTDPVFIIQASASVRYLAQARTATLVEGAWSLDKNTSTSSPSSVYDHIHVPCMLQGADRKATLIHASNAIFSPPFHKVVGCTGVREQAHAILADDFWTDLMGSDVWLVDPRLLHGAQDITGLHTFLHQSGVRSFCHIDPRTHHCHGRDVEALQPWSEFDGFKWPEQVLSRADVAIEDFVPGPWLTNFLESLGGEAMPSSSCKDAFWLVAAASVLDFSEMLRASACSTPIPSSLFCMLKAVPWIPDSHGNVRPPAELLRDLQIEFTFGKGGKLHRKIFKTCARDCFPLDAQNRFVPSEIVVKPVAQFLLDALEIRPCGARDILAVLQHWSSESLSKTTEAELTRMYVFLHTRESIEDRLEIAQAFRDRKEPLIFVPDAFHETKVIHEEKILNGQPTASRQGLWYTIHQCCVREWRALRNDILPPKQDRLLSKFGVKELEVHYGRILSDPFVGFGVSYEVNMEMLVDACSNAALASNVNFVEEVLAFYSQRLCNDEISEFRGLLAQYRVILTSADVWVKWKLELGSEEEDTDEESVEVFLPMQGASMSRDISILHRRFSRYEDLFLKLGMHHATSSLSIDPAAADHQSATFSVDVGEIVSQSKEAKTLGTLFAYMQIWLHERSHKEKYTDIERLLARGASVVAAKNINFEGRPVLTKWDPDKLCLYFKPDHSLPSLDLLNAAVSELLSELLGNSLPFLALCMNDVLNGILTNSSYPGVAAERAMTKHGVARPWPDLQWWFGAAPLHTEHIHQDEANYSHRHETVSNSLRLASTHQLGPGEWNRLQKQHPEVALQSAFGQDDNSEGLQLSTADVAPQLSASAPEFQPGTIATIDMGDNRPQPSTDMHGSQPWHGNLTVMPMIVWRPLSADALAFQPGGRTTSTMLTEGHIQKLSVAAPEIRSQNANLTTVVTSGLTPLSVDAPEFRPESCKVSTIAKGGHTSMHSGETPEFEFSHNDLTTVATSDPAPLLSANAPEFLPTSSASSPAAVENPAPGLSAHAPEFLPWSHGTNPSNEMKSTSSVGGVSVLAGDRTVLPPPGFEDVGPLFSKSMTNKYQDDSGWDDACTGSSNLGVNPPRQAAVVQFANRSASAATGSAHTSGSGATGAAACMQWRPDDLTRVRAQSVDEDEESVKVFDVKRHRYVPGKVVERQATGCHVELLIDDVFSRPVQWYPSEQILPMSDDQQEYVSGRAVEYMAQSEPLADVGQSVHQSQPGNFTRACGISDRPPRSWPVFINPVESILEDDSNDLGLKFKAGLDLLNEMLEEIRGAQPQGIQVAKLRPAETSCSMGHAARSLHITGAQLFRSLIQIYVENHGPEMMARQHERHLTVTEAVLPVEGLRFTHAQISPTFRGDPHRGEPIENLLHDLESGTIKLADLQPLLAVRFEDRVHILNNRRLWVAKEFQRRSKTVQKVGVLIFDLCPITAKFLMSYTSEDDGQSVKIRET